MSKGIACHYFHAVGEDVVDEEPGGVKILHHLEGQRALEVVASAIYEYFEPLDGSVRDMFLDLADGEFVRGLDVGEVQRVAEVGRLVVSAIFTKLLVHRQQNFKELLRLLALVGAAVQDFLGDP